MAWEASRLALCKSLPLNDCDDRPPLSLGLLPCSIFITPAAAACARASSYVCLFVTNHPSLALETLEHQPLCSFKSYNITSFLFVVIYVILLVAFLQIHHSDLEHHAANDGFWSFLAPSLSSFASSSSPQHSWVKMLVCRVSVPPTSPTSNKPHITTNVLQNLIISIVTKSVKTKRDILACIIFKLSFAVWYDRVMSIFVQCCLVWK